MEAEETARDKFSRTQERVAAEFLASTKEKVVAAVPVLEEAVVLLMNAIAPFEDLYMQAVRRQMPVPRMLDFVPTAQRELRRLIAGINSWGRN